MAAAPMWSSSVARSKSAGMVVGRKGTAAGRCDPPMTLRGGESELGQAWMIRQKTNRKSKIHTRHSKTRYASDQFPPGRAHSITSHDQCSAMLSLTDIETRMVRRSA